MTTQKPRPGVGQIFTTGAFCKPMKWTNPQTGKTQWQWVITSFEDDSYSCGSYVNPAEVSETRENLINHQDC